MIVEGFDVHHIDGNHENNDPQNLVLIEHTDHMMLHGGRHLGRLKPYTSAGRPRRFKRKTAKAQYEATQAALREQLRREGAGE